MNISENIVYGHLHSTKYQISVGQVAAINKLKDLIDNACLSNEPLSKKRLILKNTKCHDVNELMYEWFKQCRTRNIPISGPIIKERAKKYADALGIYDFAASEGWLQRFKTRHNISMKQISGESSSVDIQTVEAWKACLQIICEGYADEDILNTDETGIFWRALPNKTLAFKGKSVYGMKESKERITCLLTVSRTGEKFKPIVIGKSANPRAFKNINKKKLPVNYFNNKKAWMTSKIFQDYLKDLNANMIKQKRKILLLSDNCSSHTSAVEELRKQNIELSNVKVSFYPPN